MLNDFLIIWGISGFLFSVLAIGRRISLGARATIVGPNRFPELGALSEEEQQSVLDLADKEVFSGWRMVLLPCARALVLATIVSFAQSGISTSIWLGIVLAAVPAVFGELIIQRVEISLLRGRMRRHLEAKAAK